jgi:very-short-patch-repair endonuclease
MTAVPVLRSDPIAELLEQQDGAISVEQVLSRGMSYDTIEAHLAARRWQRLYRGVFATFSGPIPFRTQLWAALLRVGNTATGSHLTAAYLEGLADEPGDSIHITVDVCRRVTVPLPGVRVHYAHRLPFMRHPARLPPRTRIEETVLDLVADARSVDEVATWVTRACQRRLTTPTRLAEALAARKKIRWRAELEAMVSDVADGALSPLELEYLRRVERSHGLPTGVRNRRWVDRRVRWIDVDLDEYDVRVELDGRIGHEDEGRFRDRRRDNRSTVNGKATLRYGHAEVFGDPCGVAAEVAAVLRARGWAGRLRACNAECNVSP